MIPQNIKDSFPIVFQDDPKCDMLTDKMDKILGEIKGDILGLSSSHDPMRCKSACIEPLAEMMNVTLEDSDTETQRRKKILNANTTNKLFGTWKQNKIAIDVICGGDSKIVQKIPEDDWVMTGGSDDKISFLDTWAVMGGADDEALYGILMLGSKTTYQKGTVYINVDNNSLSEKEQARLKEKMLSSTPIGIIIHFSWLTEDNEFINYFTIGETNEQV